MLFFIIYNELDEDDPDKKAYLQRKITEYMTRAETIKDHIKEQQSKGEIIDKIHIIANGTNFSYETIFGKYLTDDIREVSLEEPYLREYYQVFSTKKWHHQPNALTFRSKYQLFWISNLLLVNESSSIL